MMQEPPFQAMRGLPDPASRRLRALRVGRTRSWKQIKYYRSFQAGPDHHLVRRPDGFRGLGRQRDRHADPDDGGRAAQMVGLLLPSDFVGRPGRPAAYDVTATTEW
jgi:hypothetical protein